MTKSGNWRGNGWRNGWSLGKQGSCFIVPLKTEGYDPYIDYLKGVSIFFVVLAHCLLIYNCLLFSLWGVQSVPLFLLIQTFHVHKKGGIWRLNCRISKNCYFIFSTKQRPFLIECLFRHSVQRITSLTTFFINGIRIPTEK